MGLTIDGKPILARTLAADIYSALEDAQEAAIREIEKELNALLDLLKSASPNRGRGKFSRDYNNPLKNAKVIVEKLGDHYVAYVDSYLFSLLDGGAKPKRAQNSKYMTFPVYSGKRTIPNKLTLSRNRVRVDGKRWVRIRQNDGFAARNYYQQIIHKVLRKKKTTASGRKSSKYFEFEFTSGDVILLTLEKR